MGPKLEKVRDMAYDGTKVALSAIMAGLASAGLYELDDAFQGEPVRPVGLAVAEFINHFSAVERAPNSYDPFDIIVGVIGNIAIALILLPDMPQITERSPH